MADEAQKREYFSTFTASDLKGICQKAGLKISFKKDQLIDQIIAKAIPVDLPPAVTITDDFHSMMEIFYDIYINDVRANLDRFHPIYIPAAWNWVLTDADCTAV